MWMAQMYSLKNRTSYALFQGFTKINNLKRKISVKYFFIISDCGKSIHSDGNGGLIKSPHYPQKYKSKTFCEWNIYASKKENKILLQLESFKIEGKMPNETNSKAGNVFVYFIFLVNYKLQCMLLLLFKYNTVLVLLSSSAICISELERYRTSLGIFKIHGVNT